VLEVLMLGGNVVGVERVVDPLEQERVQRRVRGDVSGDQPERREEYDAEQ
jgi:hypothetical protein